MGREFDPQAENIDRWCVLKPSRQSLVIAGAALRGIKAGSVISLLVVRGLLQEEEAGLPSPLPLGSCLTV